MDAVSNPSNPHAHCVGGAKRFIGCKLHLGTAQLFKRSEPLGRFFESQAIRPSYRADTP
jgi:hypothetical protein